MADRPLFRIVENEVRDDHRYVRVEPADPGTLITELVPRVTIRYFDEATARERLARVAEGLTLFDGSHLAPTEQEIDEAVAAERDAVLPAAWRGDRPRALDVQRSEFGEIIAADVLQTLFGTAIPASRIAHKETPDQQARGADVMGLEEITQPRVVLVLSEVKGSMSPDSPPSVVEGMETKLRQLVGDRRVLCQELIWLRDHSSNEHASLCAGVCASFLLKRPVFDILIAPILIRTRACVNAMDPGVFATDPDSFQCTVRWITVVVEGDLFDLAAEVYRRAREAAA